MDALSREDDEVEDFAHIAKQTAVTARSHSKSTTRFDGCREVAIVAMSASTFHHWR